MNILSEKLQQLIKPVENWLKLLWCGQFLSLGIYVFIASRAEGSVVPENNVNTFPVPIVIYMAASVVLFSFVFRWLTLSPRAVARIFNTGVPGWMKGVNTSGITASFVKVDAQQLDGLSDGERNLYAYSSLLFSVIIIQWGMIHTCALFGMIFSMPARQLSLAIGCGALSAVCMLFHFPNITARFAAGAEHAEFARNR